MLLKEKLTLSILPEKLGICHLGKNSPIPEWAKRTEGFCSITRTPDELSVVCPQEEIPNEVMAEKDWRVLKVKGPLGFVLTGIVSSLSTPLAKAGISILYISTYETDYLLVKDQDLAKTIEILEKFCNIIK
ncbi:ACT domain-containing protein [bacterium]|nr:ACT domain-containing protein [bacterium]